jgi:glycosyltransferase involved in cell wall biosynthesis
MNTPFFSIIIPTFNSDNTLNGALLSILNQKFVDFEVLIIDNLSTDKTVSLAKGFNDKRIKIYSEKDFGIYDAMNKGIELSTGKWLYFLGSDDLFFDKEVLSKVKSNISCFDTVVYGSVKIHGNVSWANNNSFYDGKFTSKKFSHKNICHQSLFYKRKTIIKNSTRFNIKYEICADWEFNMRLWQNNYFRYLDFVVAVFNAGGISSNAKSDYEFETDFPVLLKRHLKINKLIHQPKIFQIILFFFQNKL